MSHRLLGYRLSLLLYAYVGSAFRILRHNIKKREGSRIYQRVSIACLWAVVIERLLHDHDYIPVEKSDRPLN